MTAPGGERIPVPGRALPLLVYLLLHRDQSISRAALAQTLYPDYVEPQNRARLRANLHALVHALPPDPPLPWLLSEPDSVGLNRDAAIWLDVAEFDRLAADPERLAEAAALHAGDIAPSLTDEWIAPIREQYRRRYTGVLETLVTRHRRARDFANAVAYAERLLEIDPWREDIVRRIMAIRHEMGDRSGALAFFDRFSERLQNELGTGPMPETRLARDAVLHDEPPDVDSADQTLSSSDRNRESRQVLPFVGRIEELAALFGHWNRTAGGNGGLLLIGGEAGIGKSRLAEELARHVQEHGGRVLRGGAAYPETTPYQCFVEALRSAGPLLASIDLPPVWLAALADLLPELRERVNDVVPARLDPERERQRLFESIVRAVLALARPRPLLVVLEDLHWADEATASALLFLARRTLLAPVLVVATYREGEIDAAHPIRSLRRELLAQGLLVHLAPQPLGLADVAELAGTDRAAALLQRSEGNPLLLMHLIQAGTPDSEPRELQSLIDAQLMQLDADSRILAEVAALLGTQFSTEVLEEATGWNASAVARGLDALIARRIVREPVRLGGLEYEFSHQLVRDAIAASVPLERAQQRHRRIALVLERLYPDRLSELAATLAAHFEGAGDSTAAAQYYLKAAKHAAQVGAQESAFAHFDRGLRCARDNHIRADLLLGREALLHLRGERAAQQSDLDSLQAITHDGGDAALHREVIYRRLCRATAMGLLDEQRALLEELRTVTPDGSAAWKRRVLLAQGDLFKRIGRYDDAFAAVQQALDESRDDDEGSERAEALCLLANIEVWRGRFAQATSLLQEAAPVAASPVSKRRVLEERANHAIEQDDFVQLLPICAELSELCRTIGDRKGEAAALTWTGIAFTRLDRYAEALSELERAHRIAQEIDDRPRVATVLVNRAHLFMVLGALREAAALLERARELHEAQGAEGGKITCISNLSAIHAYMGDAPRALELARQAADLSGEGKSPGRFAEALENVAEAHACAGNYAAAIDAMESAVGQRRKLDWNVTVAWCLANLALWYAAIGDLQNARERITAMLSDEDRIPTGNPWPQFCYWAAARIAELSGEETASRAMLRKAHDLLRAQAANCPTPELRDSFLALPWNREILAAQDADTAVF